MRGHLTDTEMMEALGGEPAGETFAHLVGCPTCRAERDRLRATLADLAEQARVQAEWREEFWERQRRQIAGRMSDRRSLAPGWSWAWAPAAVGLAVVALVWFYGKTPQPSPEPAADDALLISVERSLQAECPVALQPAALLAAEVERRGAETGRGADIPAGGQL
jgi:predicted anti-sigma-YlaC factor YlaD